jgi:hypothetical protein
MLRLAVGILQYKIVNLSVYAQIESVDNTSWDNHVSHNMSRGVTLYLIKHMWHYIIVRPN